MSRHSRAYELALAKRHLGLETIHSSSSSSSSESISNKRVKIAPDSKETAPIPRLPLMAAFPTADPLMARAMSALAVPSIPVPCDPYPWSRDEHAAFHRESITAYRQYLVPPPDKPPTISTFADVPSLVASALYWLEIAFLHFRATSDGPLAAFFDIDDTIIVKGPKPLYEEMLHPDVYPIYEWCIRRSVQVTFITARHDTPSARGATESLLREFRLRYHYLSLMPPMLIPHVICKPGSEIGKVYVGSNIPLILVNDQGDDVQVDLKEPIRLEPATSWEGPGGVALRRAVAKFKGNVRKASSVKVILNIGNEVTDLFSSTESKHAKRLTSMGEETPCLLAGEAADDASLSIKLPSRPRIRWMPVVSAFPPNTNPSPSPNPIPVPPSIGHSITWHKPTILRERPKPIPSQTNPPPINIDAITENVTSSSSTKPQACGTSFPIARDP